MPESICNQVPSVYAPSSHPYGLGEKEGSGKPYHSIPSKEDWLKILTWKAHHPPPEQLSNRREWAKQKNEWNQTISSLQKIYYFIASSMLLSSAQLASTLHGAQSVGGLCWCFFCCSVTYTYSSGKQTND